MPTITTFEDFDIIADRMVSSSDPRRFRFAIKYRHNDGVVTLTITDDVERFKFTSNLAQDVKKMEKLNNKLLRKMMEKV